MVAVLADFVTIRKTRGDVLRPAEFRSIVEMIRGILTQYDYSGFNEAYQDFLKHLEDYDDPHHVTNTSFAAEIIERTHAIYTKMTASPLSLEDFQEQVVPTLGFVELIRRIVLNRYLYDQVKNTDGSVPANATVYINNDWGHNIAPNTPVTLSFGSVLADETAFLAKGWTTNTTPIPVVFNANNLDVEIPHREVVFHTSSTSPYYAIDDTGSGYPISLFGSSNDFCIDIVTIGSPISKIALFTMLNGTNIFTISMNTNNSVELKFDSLVIADSLPCNDGKIYVTMSRNGTISVRVSNNSIWTTNSYQLTFSNVGAFITGIVGSQLESLFGGRFGIRELTIYKAHPILIPETITIPMIVYMPSATSDPLTGSANASGATGALVPTVGYNLYLTLTGTWSGTVRVQKTVDNGINWTTVTAGGGAQIGVFTQNCDESVLKVTDPKARYRLQFTMTSGTVVYRLGQ